jgi:hypothetical protein
VAPISVDAEATSTAPGVSVPSIVQLRALMELIHQSSQNKQHKIELVRAQMRVTLFLLSAAIAAIVFARVTSSSNALDILMPVSFGVLGALLSMIFGLGSMSSGRRIPELRSALEINLMRPLIGAGSALVVALMLDTGFVNLGSQKAGTALVFSFIAGFSERWFKDKVDKIAQESG